MKLGDGHCLPNLMKNQKISHKVEKNPLKLQKHPMEGI